METIPPGQTWIRNAAESYNKRSFDSFFVPRRQLSESINSTQRILFLLTSIGHVAMSLRANVALGQTGTMNDYLLARASRSSWIKSEMKKVCCSSGALIHPNRGISTGPMDGQTRAETSWRKTENPK